MNYYKSGQKYRDAFNKLDSDRDGYIALNELPRSIAMVNVDDELTKEQQKRLLKTTDHLDFDHDGRLDYNEFVRVISKPDYHATRAKKILYRTADVVTPIPKSDQVYTYINEYTCLPPPLFLIIVSLAEIGVYLWYVQHSKDGDWITHCAGCFEKSGEIGLLAFSPKLRRDSWRFVSYMLIHSGIAHMISNVVVQIALGVPLEMVHKFWRIGPLYLAGVILGAMVQAIVDPNVILVGASGGCYALLTAHVANLALNWSEMKARWIRLILLLIFFGLDIFNVVYNRFLGKCELTSYAAHVGGALAGLFLGFVVLKNLNYRPWERYLWIGGLVLFSALLTACICLNIFLPLEREPFLTVRCNVNASSGSTSTPEST